MVELNYAMVGSDFVVSHKNPEVITKAAKTVGRKPVEDDRGNKIIELDGETFQRAKALLAGKGFSLQPMP